MTRMNGCWRHERATARVLHLLHAFGQAFPEVLALLFLQESVGGGRMLAAEEGSQFTLIG